MIDICNFEMQSRDFCPASEPCGRETGTYLRWSILRIPRNPVCVRNEPFIKVPRFWIATDCVNRGASFRTDGQAVDTSMHVGRQAELISDYRVLSGRIYVTSDYFKKKILLLDTEK